jgi:hypothetical protein
VLVTGDFNLDVLRHGKDGYCEKSRLKALKSATGVTTFATQAAQIWKASTALRTAETRSAARQVASDLARLAPL